MPSRWDCMFVGRVEIDSRIVLTTQPKYGLMGQLDYTRATFPGNNKMLSASAFATHFNDPELPNSKGLILREYEGRVAYAGRQSALSAKYGQGLRVRDTTGWKVYISPDLEYFHVVYKGGQWHKGIGLSKDDEKSIKSMVDKLVCSKS